MSNRMSIKEMKDVATSIIKHMERELKVSRDASKDIIKEVIPAESNPSNKQPEKPSTKSKKSIRSSNAVKKSKKSKRTSNSVESEKVQSKVSSKKKANETLHSLINAAQSL